MGTDETRHYKDTEKQLPVFGMVSFIERSASKKVSPMKPLRRSILCFEVKGISNLIIVLFSDPVCGQ
jgi:hypothetical protein